MKNVFSKADERAGLPRPDGRTELPDAARQLSEITAEYGRPKLKVPLEPAYYYRNPRIAPPSAKKKYVKQYSGDLSRPQQSSMREMLILLGFIIVCLLGYWGYLYVTRPPDIGNMTDKQLTRHVNKVRSLLEKDAAVLVGNESENRLEMRIFPFNGDKPMKFDSSGGFSFRTPSPPYEPSFTYWRLSHILAPPWQIINDFFDTLTDTGFISVFNYSAPKRAVSKRYVVDLFDFKLRREADLGLKPVYREGVDMPYIIPSPSGKNLYVVNSTTRFPEEYRFKVVTDLDGNRKTMNFYAKRSDWIKSGENDLTGFYLSEPQPCEDGFVSFAYATYTVREAQSEVVRRISVLKFELPKTAGSAVQSKQRHKAGRWSDELSIETDIECPVRELARIENETDAVTEDAVNRFVNLYFDEKSRRALGYIVSGEQGDYAATFAYFDSTGEITPVAEFNVATQMYLVDYRRGQMFLMSGEKPTPVTESRDGESLDNEPAAGETEDAPVRRMTQWSYWLNRIDLETMDIVPIRELKAASRTSLSGNNYESVPILTLSVQQRRVVTTDGDSLVLLDYDGNLVKTLETDDKMSYGLLYAMNKLESAKR